MAATKTRRRNRSTAKKKTTSTTTLTRLLNAVAEGKKGSRTRLRKFIASEKKKSLAKGKKSCRA